MRKTVQEGHVGLLWRRGKIVRELGPGRHRYSAFGGQKIDIIDVRSSQLSNPLEEFATKDNLSVRCAMNISYHVESASAVARTTADQASLLRTKMTDTLRAEICKHTLDELLAMITDVRDKVEAKLKDEVTKSGIELESVSPLSLQIPRSLR